MSAGATTIRRARAVFQCALELDGDERKLFVEDACGGDVELEQLVFRLLAADDAEPESFGASAFEIPAEFAQAHRRIPLPQGYTPIR